MARNKSVKYALEAIALTEQAKVISLSTPIALSAADFSIEYKLSFADSIIYASAKFHKAELITSDNHFKGLSEVVYIMKK